MPAFLAKRALGMVAVLFAVSVLVFAIFNLIPNTDPAEAIAGKSATPQLIAGVEEEFGLDEPLPVQYLTQMKLILSGQLISYNGRVDVDQRILEGVPATFSLCIGAALIWLALGVLFGYLSATRAGRFTDRVLSLLAVTGISTPVFLVASVLLILFTDKLELFPSSGYVPLTEDPVEWANHLILPWITLSVLFIGFYSRVLRATMLDAMGEDYVRTARAKGLSERQVMTRHVLRNSMIPIVTLFGLDFGAVLGGTAIVTESVFSLGGVGQYVAESASGLDLPPIMAITLFGAFFIVLFNTVVDVAYAFLDPRVRLGRRES